MTAIEVAVDVVRDLFRVAVEELIECYADDQFMLAEHVDCDLHPELTAIVGLGDKQFSASVALVATENAVRSLSLTSLNDPGDWLGELSNQLAGRLKNKLSGYGCQPRLSTPTIVRGQDIQLSSPATTRMALQVQFKSTILSVQLSLELGPDFELVEMAENDTLLEGSFELF